MRARCFAALVIAASMVVPIIVHLESDVPNWYAGLVLVISLAAAGVIIVGTHELIETPKCPRCEHRNAERLYVQNTVLTMVRCRNCGACWHPK